MPQNITIHPPVGGTVRRLSFQNQAPYTSYDSYNYWPIDVKTGRLIPAIRPPHNMLANVDGPVNLLQRVNGYATGKPVQSFIAAEGTDLYWWDGDSLVAATGAAASDIDANRPLFAATYLDKVYIPQATGKIQVFDYQTGAVAEIVESAGTAPVDVDFMAFHLGGVWAIKDNAMYVARIGAPLDWDFSAPSDDLYGAFFFDGEFSGLLGGLITALVPVSNDFAIVSTVEGMLALRGHPRQGGVIEPIITNAYILGQGAWCQTPDSTAWFMTPLGLMRMEPSPGAIPTQVSREKIPDELVGLQYDRDDPVIQMAYEPRWNGILIYVRGMETQAWLYDIATGGFNRMDCPADVLALMNFPPFSTEQNSTMLHGRWDGISYYDKFGEEAIPGSILVGPFKLSRTALDSGRLEQLLVVFGRDTPVDVTGRLRVATGVDAQDCVSRMSSGTHQFSVDLNVLKANYGKCFPKLTGHAALIAIDTDTGDLAFEEMVVTVEEAGRRRFARAPQLSVTGIATDFTDAYEELDDEVWRGYSSTTIAVAPGGTLSDHTHFLDLSLMPDAWWDEVQEDGRDVRVSTTSNVEIPCKVLQINKATQEGLLAFLVTREVAALSVRVWCGNPFAVPPDAAIFDSDWGLFMADGCGYDAVGIASRTEGTAFADSGFTYGDVPGPMGGFGTALFRWDGVKGVDQYWATFAADLGVATSHNDWTLGFAFKGDAGLTQSTYNQFKLGPTSASTSFRGCFAAGNGGGTNRSQVTVQVPTGGTASTLASADGGRFLWQHYMGTYDTTNYRGYLNGTAATQQAISNDPTAVVLSMNELFQHCQGDLAIVQAHKVTRSATWVAYQAAMMNQSTFWGAFGAFVNVNPAVDPPTDLPVVSCPTGPEPFVEVGSWTGFCAATPVAPTAPLLYHTHLIDLANMHASWWSAVSSSGIDIRATDTNNVPIPFCLINFDKSGNTGLAAVRLHQFLDSQNEVRLWVGNGSAVAVPPCADYGAYSAFDSNYLAFYGNGRGNDSTGNVRHLTDNGDVSVVSGPIGNSAATFGLTGRSSAEVTTSMVPDQVTISAAVKASTSLNACTVGGIFNVGTPGRVMLATAASSIPCRSYVTDAAGRTGTVLNDVNPGVVNWFHMAGVVANANTRRLWINGGGDQSTSGTSVQMPSFNRISIGAYPNSAANSNPITVSLFGVHSVVRPQSWTVYQTQMLDQDAFWQETTWPWTAGSLTL